MAPCQDPSTDFLRQLNHLIVAGICQELEAVVGAPLGLRWPPDTTLAGLCNAMAFCARITGHDPSTFLASKPCVASEDIAAFAKVWGDLRELPAWDNPSVLEVERRIGGICDVPHPLYRRPVHLLMQAYALVANQLVQYCRRPESLVAERVAATIQHYPIELFLRYQRDTSPPVAAKPKSKQRSKK